jgi:hypothetical protein
MPSCPTGSISLIGIRRWPILLPLTKAIDRHSRLRGKDAIDLQE